MSSMMNSQVVPLLMRLCMDFGVLIRSHGYDMQVFTRISPSSLGLPRKSYIWVGQKKVKTEAGKKDDYTRLQNLNSLFMVMGSVSSPEETLQLQRTLSFMRENDGNDRMSVQSFEHCIEQVVRFHFPSKRNLRHVHWNARQLLINPLWVHASVLDFARSVHESMIGLLLVSGLRESLKGGKKRWTSKCEKEYLEIRQFIEKLVVRNARQGQDLSVLFF